MTQFISRRDILKRAGAAGVVALVPAALPASVEGMVAAEIGIQVGAVTNLDADVLEPPGHRDVELRNDLECVGQVDAGVLLSCGDVSVSL